jgi:hypothetical protein
VTARRRFALWIPDEEQDVRRVVEAETFFEARASLARELHVEPGEIRLDHDTKNKAGET